MNVLSHRDRLVVQTALALALAAGAGCGDSQGEDADGGAGAGVLTSTGVTGGSGGQGTGGASTTSSTGTGAGAPDDLEDLLARLRADADGTLLDESRQDGWPVPVVEGYVIATTDPAWSQVAGDFDAWAGTALQPDDGFSWALVPAAPGQGYKLKAGSDFGADPWARSYAYDDFGELSLVQPPEAHLDRHLLTGDPALLDRQLRVWVPSVAPTHVLYVHDGQNLFDPNAFFGGWQLDASAPDGMLLVGVDNTVDRFEEYTHVTDVIGGDAVGGEGDAYADYLQSTVRPLVADVYGEPPVVGVMGSSLGGLISLHVAQRHPGEYDFAASLSGTLGWGSIGADNETLIERYAAAGHGSTAIYVDSGGTGDCVDSDGDGIEDDDPGAGDNYCETIQMRDVLESVGYAYDVDLFHWHEPGAPHNEAAWAARVFRPLDIFAGL